LWQDRQTECISSKEGRVLPENEKNSEKVRRQLGKNRTSSRNNKQV
jgi:hypothetical protein